MTTSEMKYPIKPFMVLCDRSQLSTPYTKAFDSYAAAEKYAAGVDKSRNPQVFTNMTKDLVDALHNLLEQTVLSDIRYGVALTEGETQAKRQAMRALNAFYGVKDTKPMTLDEVMEDFECAFCRSGEPCDRDCYRDSTCSLVCRNCLNSNYFSGNLEEAPEEFDCAYCGKTMHNKHKEV